MGINGLRLWYSNESNFTLEGYKNVDYVGYLIDWRSTKGTK